MSDIDSLHDTLSAKNNLGLLRIIWTANWSHKLRGLLSPSEFLLLFLISAVVAGYVVLREQMQTQKYLAEANTHINVIHRTLIESVSLLQDFRDKSEATPPNVRLVKMIMPAALADDIYGALLSPLQVPRKISKSHWGTRVLAARLPLATHTFFHMRQYHQFSVPLVNA